MCIAFLVGSLFSQAWATDRYYEDLSAESPSGRYQVEAKSPDNAVPGKRLAFQSSFVYTCRDTSGNGVVWTRKQPKPEARTARKAKASPYVREEDSPVALFVSDAGWTVIRTGWDQLIAVDVTGHDRWRVELLSEGFTKEERAAYVVETTAGPFWSGFSQWYFLDGENQSLFVIRPWWGRHILVNIESGKFVAETLALAKLAAAYEHNYVVA